MKNYFIGFILIFIWQNLSSQNNAFEYTGRMVGAISKDKLHHAKFLREITPQFNRYFFLPKAEHDLLMLLKKYDYTQDYLYPEENYSNVMEYVSIAIIVTYDDQTFKAESMNDVLTEEQTGLLRKVQEGADITIRIKFRFKNPNAYKLHTGTEILEGFYRLTVIPEIEASYPGGFTALSAYLNENVFAKINVNDLKKMQRPIVIFTINSNGNPSNVRLVESSQMQKIDYLIIEAIKNMPRWTPAKSKNGSNTTQVFTIPFGDGC